MERFARAFLFILIAAALAGRVFSPTNSSPGTITLHARQPENGGWGPDVIQARVGQPLHLRVTSDDVQHSFAVGQMDLAPVNIAPGEWKDISIVFDKPGMYTYYCDRWCGPEHWRMRGTIEVSGDETATGIPESIQQPLYLALKIDIDAPHQAKATPSAKPDPKHGAELAARLPGYATETQTYQSSSPEDLWKRLRAEPALANLNDASLWDAVAWVWQGNTNAAQLRQGRELFAQNCAACHGEQGGGDGVMVRALPTPSHESDGRMDSRTKTRPPDFTHPAELLSASPALLQGKIMRGGMGTGMPSWGPILTPAQIDALVNYLYTLAMP